MGIGKVKVAVVGCGGEARHYISHYTAMPEVDLILVQDIVHEKAEESAARFGAARWTTSFDEVLESGADIIDVSTPNHLHFAQAVAALRAGAHVLVQKPMAPTVAECEEMINTARQCGRSLGVYMSELENPINYELKRLVQKGALGTVVSVRTRNAHKGGLIMKPKDLHWRGSLEKTGGGSFIQLAIHGVNLVQWILGQDIVRVAAFSKNMLTRDRLGGDDVTNAIAEFENGVQATLESSYITDGSAIELFGTGGFARIDERDLSLRLDSTYQGEYIQYAEPKTLVRYSRAEIVEKANADPWRYCQHQAFVRSVIEGQSPPVPGEIGLRDVKIIKAIYRSAEEGCAVTVMRR